VVNGARCAAGLAIALLLLHSAVRGGPTAETAPSHIGGTGRISVLLTAGAHRDVDAVIVRIGKVEILHTDAGWKTVTEKAGTFNLHELRSHVTAALGSAYLPAGKYAALRFAVEKAFIKAGRHRISSRHRVVKIRETFCLSLGENAEILLDWNVNESLRRRDGGHHRHDHFAFRPIVDIKAAPSCDRVDRVEDAIGLAQGGDHEGAIAAFANIIALDPGSAAAYAYRGFSYAALGQRVNAEADFQSAKQIVLDDLGEITAENPGDADAQFKHALLLSDMGEHAQAIATLTSLALRDPTKAETHFRLGNARFRSGDIPGSVQDYDNAIALDVGDFRLYLARASAKQALGDQAGADVDIEAARVRLSEDKIH
jgi:tetratricopeptide (TPR) repeat protein